MRLSRIALPPAALWAALATSLVVSAQTQPAVMPAVQVVHAFQEAWSSGRVERVLALFADDAVVIDARNGGTHTGRDAVFRWLAAQLSQETHIVSGWGYEAAGELVSWNTRLSTFSSRALRAPPVEAAMQTVVRDGRISRHVVSVDGDSLTRQRGAVRDAFATRTALIEADGPALGSLPAAPTYPPYQPLPLPNVNDRSAPALLPWLAVGAASLACVMLALLKKPPRL